MIKPYELTLELPIKTYSGSSTTTKVWQVLAAAKNGDLVQLKHFTEEDSDLLYVLYNYTPPIHFAVREGHTDMVDYLIQKNAYDPAYRSYPFQDSLITIAIDRGFNDIAEQLQELEKNGYS
ncbi:MAG TPA: ankyrin repeat domain-containing protein, partial [Flavisolibacter sp.]|nr:ankyrin repeat domain-containing protein [Flavisolibacter sp.]